MFEVDKIEEAKYFYDQLLAMREDYKIFKYNLSAFISAARSVLQFAFKEVRAKNQGKQWYDSIIAGKPVVSFFKDKRDINIHTEPVKVCRSINVQIQEILHISESFRVKKREALGKLTREHSYESNPAQYKKLIPTKVTYEYKFDDWSGDEDVITLCQKYLHELQDIVSNGQARGYLTNRRKL